MGGEEKANPFFFLRVFLCVCVTTRFFLDYFVVSFFRALSLYHHRRGGERDGGDHGLSVSELPVQKSFFSFLDYLVWKGL